MPTTDPKAPRIPRPRSKFTLDPTIAKRLREASEATGIPMSRIVEQGLRLRLDQIDGASSGERAA